MCLLAARKLLRTDYSCCHTCERRGPGHRQCVRLTQSASRRAQCCGNNLPKMANFRSQRDVTTVYVLSKSGYTQTNSCCHSGAQRSTRLHCLLFPFTISEIRPTVRIHAVTRKNHWHGLHSLHVVAIRPLAAAAVASVPGHWGNLTHKYGLLWSKRQSKILPVHPP